MRTAEHGWASPLRPGLRSVAFTIAAFLAPHPVHPANPAETRPATEAAEVPKAFLARLQAQYVPEDSKDPTISDADKIRRYRAILREGAWAERQYAGAADLYRVRGLMMAAAKGLATLEGTAQAGRRLMEVARRLAESDAPAEARLPADVLVYRALIAALGPSPAEAADEIEWLIARYADTPLAAKALIGAAKLAEIADARPLRRRVLRLLHGRHFGEAGVSQFLESRGQAPFHGRLMSARLSRADGSTISLPRDGMGRLTVLHFWTMQNSGLVGRSNVRMTAAYEKLHDKGLEFIGINLDTDRAAALRFAREQGLPWPQTCSGLGGKDATFLHYNVPTLPAWWVVSPDGRGVANNYHEGSHGHVVDWAGFVRGVQQTLDLLGETMSRVPYYRSGEFLLDVPEVFATARPADGDVPADVMDAVRDGVALPPSLGLSREEKAARMRQVLSLGLDAEKRHPRAANLPAVRNLLLVAARWLAVQTSDANAARQAGQIAGRILADPPAGAGRLPADYVRLSDRLAAKDVTVEAAGRRIDEFRRSYARGAAAWAADILAVMLASECGDEKTRVEAVRALAARASDQPAVRGFLRDFCCANVDARTSQFQYSPLCTMAAGGEHLPNEPYAVRAVLPRLRGGVFRLPEDARGKAVLLQFWSAACPPVDLPLVFTRKRDSDVDLTSKVVVVAVNLDRSRDAAAGYVSENRFCDGWVHVFSGKGWDDPLARELDVYGLPRTVLVDRSGTIYRWGTPVQLGDAVLRAAMIPPGEPGGPPGKAPKQAAAPAPAAKAVEAPPTPAPAAAPKELSLPVGGAAAMKLVLVAPGEFRMGPTAREVSEFFDDPGYRSVILTKPFYLGACPVTRGQFAAFVKDTEYVTEAERDGWALLLSGGRWKRVPKACWQKPGFEQADDHPVVCVSFSDAEEFCKWLGRTSGRTVHLPTEAQWECACRAGGPTLYPWGDDPNAGAGFCNAADRSAGRRPAHRSAFRWNDGYAFTSPIGTFKPNALGVYDMTGNVWQWTANWFGKGFRWRHEWPDDRYDPVGPSSGAYKATRGGSWAGGPADCRSAARRPAAPQARMNTLGFRVALPAPQAAGSKQ